MQDIKNNNLPSPIIGLIKKHNNIRPDRYEQRLQVLVELAEITIKLFAAIMAKYYLVEGAENEEFRKCLSDFQRSSPGHWLKLLRLSVNLLAKDDKLTGLPKSIVDWYYLRLGNNVEIIESIKSLSIALPELNIPKGKISIYSVLDLFVNIRNKRSHGAQVTDEEIKERCILLHKLIIAVLSKYSSETLYTYCYIEEVRYAGKLFNIEAMQFNDSGQQYLSYFSDTPLNDGRFYVIRSGNNDNIIEAIDLSPYLIVRLCCVCKTKQILVYNSMKGNTIEYLSYMCGHPNNLEDPLSDFNNIESFFEGKVSLNDLLEGKIIGKEIKISGISNHITSNEEYTKFLIKGKELIGHNQLEEAYAVLQNASRLNDICPEARHLLGLISLYLSKKHEITLEHLDASCRLAPDAYLYHLNSGIVCNLFKLEIRALDYLNKALELNPSSEVVRSEISELGDILVADNIDNIDCNEQKAKELAISLLGSLKSKPLGLKIWHSAIFPWNIVCKKPYLYSLLLTLLLLLFEISINIKHVLVDINVAYRILVVSLLIYLGLLVPAITPILLENTFNKLKSTVLLPESSFISWFITETSVFLGSVNFVRDNEKYDVKDLWKYDKQFVIWFAISGIVFMPFQIACAYGYDGFKWDISLLSRYILYFIEVYTLSWIPIYVFRSLALIPKFVTLPIRYFPGMPDNVSLKPLGSFFLIISSLASLTYVLCTVQHILFETYKKVPLFSFSFILIMYPFAFLILFVSQCLIYSTLNKLKERKLLEYSYHIENEFRNLMKNPSTESFEKYFELNNNIRKIGKMMSVSSFTKSSIIIFIVTAVLQTLSVVISISLFFRTKV